MMTQISMMDWGVSDIYELHIDYIQVDLVNINDNHIQHGLPLEYHEVLKSSSYQEEIIANTNLRRVKQLLIFLNPFCND